MLKEIKLLRKMCKRKIQTSNFLIDFSPHLSDQTATQCPNTSSNLLFPREVRVASNLWCCTHHWEESILNCSSFWSWTPETRTSASLRHVSSIICRIVTSRHVHCFTWRSKYSPRDSWAMPHEHGEAALHGKTAMGRAVHQAWGSRKLEH